MAEEEYQSAVRQSDQELIAGQADEGGAAEEETSTTQESEQTSKIETTTQTAGLPEIEPTPSSPDLVVMDQIKTRPETDTVPKKPQGETTLCAGESSTVAESFFVFF